MFLKPRILNRNLDTLHGKLEYTSSYHHFTQTFSAKFNFHTLKNKCKNKQTNWQNDQIQSNG